MNSEQWTKLLEATKGRTPGPWGAHRQSIINAARDIECSIRGEAWKEKDRSIFESGVSANIALIASAPALLAEVERLRGWLRVIVDRVSIRSDTLTEKQIKAALNGAEAPE